jgi:hypothetical protein
MRRRIHACASNGSVLAYEPCASENKASRRFIQAKAMTGRGAQPRNAGINVGKGEVCDRLGGLESRSKMD